MEYNRDKVDEMVLALFYLTSTQDQHGAKAWGGLDLGALERLQQKGLIDAPQRRSMSIRLTEAGAKRSKELFLQYFGTKEDE